MSGGRALIAVALVLLGHGFGDATSHDRPGWALLFLLLFALIGACLTLLVVPYGP